MGYDTVFEGEFKTDKPLDEETYRLLLGLSKTRRMKRDAAKLKEKYGKDFGQEGEFFVDSDETEEAVLDSNKPPGWQPGLWLRWAPKEDRQTIAWTGWENTYFADKWVMYLVARVLMPRGYALSGAFNATGLEPGDKWHLIAENNEIKVRCGHTKQAGIPSFKKWMKETYGI